MIDPLPDIKRILPNGKAERNFTGCTSGSLITGMFYTKLNTSISQGIAALFVAGIHLGFTNLYTTLVCVACSQLEKLKLDLLNIRETDVISEQLCGKEIRQSDFHEQPRLSDEPFCHMLEQLNNCIRHHQKINRCGYNKELN